MDTVQAEHLTAEEVEYHRKVIAQFQAALAIRDSWVAHLSQKYGLTQGDSVQEDGAVVRATKETSAVPVDNGGGKPA